MIRKARKDHHCTLCCRVIHAGSTYVYVRITPWDHPENESYDDYKAHTECDAFWTSGYGEEHDYEFPDAGEFRRAMAEAS